VAMAQEIINQNTIDKSKYGKKSKKIDGVIAKVVNIIF
jgi:hypothetical protein